MREARLFILLKFQFDNLFHSGPVIDPAADSIERKIMDLEKSRDKPDFGHGYVEDKFAQSDNINLSGPPIAAG